MRPTLGAILGASLAVLSLEIFFRCAPVFSGIPLAPTSDAQPFNRALPKAPYVYSHGWAMTNVQRGVSNQQGFSNSDDFADHAQVLVIGDSFIESHMLTYPQTVQGNLARMADGGVYAASASGNGLADYLQLARFYVPRMKPHNLVVFIKQNDLTGILATPDRGNNGLVVDGDQVRLVHEPYVASRLKELLTRSALLRYVYYNLKARELVSKSAVGALAVSAGDARTARARELALDYCFEQLQLLSRQYATRVVLLVDGDRKAIYAGRGAVWPGAQ